jgi:hypothetical protein
MRRFAALQTCLGLLTAFALAPFQHVHTGDGHGDDHDHAGLIHAHFYNLAAPHTNHPGRQFDDVDDDHRAAWQVDTFTVVMTVGVPPFIPSRAPAALFAPSPVAQPLTIIEERGHDPPPVSPSVPRGPPA